MATTDLIPFQFESASIRVVSNENGDWSVVAKDVAEALGYTWQPAVIKHVPAEWRGIIPITTPGGTQEMLTLTEQGLYFFLARSDKPKARPFQKWLAGDVVPSIRKTGSYAIKQQPANALEALAQQNAIIGQAIHALQDLSRQVQEQAREISEIKAALPATSSQLSIKGYANLLGVKVTVQKAGALGKRAASLSRINGRHVSTVPDDQWGVVGAYDLDILESVFQDAGVHIHKIQSIEAGAH